MSGPLTFHPVPMNLKMSDHINQSRGKSLVKVAILLVLLAASVSLLQAATVTRIAWDPPNPAFNKFILEFDEVPRYNVVNDKLESANYFYIDFYGLKQDYKRRLLEINNDPFIKYVDALSFPDSNVLRLVFYVKQAGTVYDVQTASSPPAIHVYTTKAGAVVPNTGTSVASIMPGKPESNGLSQNVSVTTEGISTQVGFEIPRIPEPDEQQARQKSSGKKYIIIDPGHGGANGGASSDIKVGSRKIQEKELTIKFAYELKKLIDSNPEMVGLLTRVDDSNVGLQDRVKMAEENKGDGGNLFISLHLNDAPNNANARGMEVYFLNQKGTVDAAVREIEAKENRDVGISQSAGGNSILKSLLTDFEKDKLEDWQYESYIFCRRLEQSMLTSPYFAKHNRGVKNANFVVLKNFEMPAVLFEIGFISNTDELRNLMDSKFQQLTAALIYNSINAYFQENDPSFRPKYVSVSGLNR